MFTINDSLNIYSNTVIIHYSVIFKDKLNITNKYFNQIIF